MAEKILQLENRNAQRGGNSFFHLSILSDLLRVLSFGLRIFLLSAAVIARADIHPIVSAQDGLLFGSAGGGQWVSHEKAKGAIKGGETYRLYSLTAALGTAKGGKPETAGEPCPDMIAIALKPKPAAAVIALAADWNALPRVPRKTDTSQPVYQKAVAEFLTARGFSKPKVRIKQILRIDLDGDGEEEVLISATNYFTKDDEVPTGTTAGSYSCVLLRRMVAGKVETHLLEGEFYPTAKQSSAPSRYEVAAVLDLDGDGKMEVIVESNYYEGGAATIYRCTGKKPTQLLSVGCGA
ncbi:MAG: hypothetical protein K8R23_05465 [Chthoniobacter sp.]|nr:hypothetical protein [Chthoniobacter sp.]